MLLHIVVLALAVLVAPAIALVALRLAAIVSSIRRARRERAALARLGGQGLRVVTGVLRVEEPLEASSPHALGCRQTSSSLRRFWFKRTSTVDRERAGKLSVVVGGRRIQLSGAVNLIAGSRVVFEGKRAAAWNPGGFAVQDLLFDGDPVTVAGAPRTASEGQAYRDRGDDVIEASEEAGAVFVCASGTPKVDASLKGRLRHVAVLVMAAVGCYPLYGFARDYSNTACSDRCKMSGDCAIESVFRHDDFAAALRRLSQGDHVECAAASDAMCRASDNCRDLGWCSAELGNCLALSAADCADTVGCVESGLCTASEGNCRAATVDDCRHTSGCLNDAQCLPRAGFCVATSEEACEALPECKRDGQCGVRDGQCAATSPEHCAATEGCERYGRCSPVAGSCSAASDADCQRSERCKEDGLCSEVNGVCVAKTDADCRGSRRCAAARECKASGAACVPDAASCRESAACTHWGACLGESFCSVGSKADCAKAEVCKGKASCRPLGGSCAASCEETAGCSQHGHCAQTANDGCAVDSDKACAASAYCRQVGFCSVRDGRCARTSSADCKKSNSCKYYGRCSFSEDDCTATANDCAASAGCKLAGKCSPGSWRCEVKSDADCKQSEVCEKRGWCTRVRTRFAIEDQCGPGPR